MHKIIKKIVIAVLLIPHIVIAVYSNLLYGRPSVAYPGSYSNCGTTYLPIYATDRVMARLYANFCDRVGYIFYSPANPASSLTISLPPGTMVRSVFISIEDSQLWQGTGTIVSVGETLQTSTRCYYTKYGKTTTTSPTGMPAWLTCDSLIGSKLFITNPTTGIVLLYEIMAFSLYNFMTIATIYSLYSTAATTGSNQANLLKTEMNIQLGTISKCYTSVFDPSPFITVQLPSSVDIQTFLAIPQIPTDIAVINSFMYSSNLIVEIYKTDSSNQLLQLVGSCEPIADPLLDAESDCHKFVGNIIKITRICPSPPCQLGLCGAGILSNCDCSVSEIGYDAFNLTIAQWQTAYKNEVSLLSEKYIKTKFQREGTKVLVNLSKINSLPDSVSTVCGNTFDGVLFCGLSRKPVILDSKGIELDLSVSDLFMLDSSTGILTVQTNNKFYIGVNQFTLTARLSDYPDKGYFNLSTEFQVEVIVEESVNFTPDSPTRYTYVIGSKMEPVKFKVNLMVDNFSLVVNDKADESFQTYGLILIYMAQGSDTVIYLSSSQDKDELAGEILNVRITFTLGNQSFSFEPITISYVASLKSQKIPCLASLDAVKWEYILPKEIYIKSEKMKVTFECKDLQNIVIFNQQKISLYLNTIANVKQPISNSYKSIFTLQDSIQGKKFIELLLNIDCSQNEFNFYNSSQSQNNKATKPTIQNATIKHITSFGEITIQWNTNITISFDQRRYLKSFRVNDRLPPSQYLKSFIDVQIIQNSDPEIVSPLLLNFTYAFQHTKPTISKIFVRFQNPVYISRGTQKDKIKISFNSLNISTDSDLPHQQSIESLQIDTEAIQKISSSLLWSAPIVQIFLGGALSGVLKFISVQVLIRHMFAPSLNFPANLQNILTGLLPLLTLDMVPTDQIYERIFEFSQLKDEPLTFQFDAIGYSQTLSVKNMGFLFIILILTPIQTLLLYILRKVLQNFKFQNRWLQYIKKSVNDQLESMIWNGYIEFFQEQCLVFCVISLIQVSKLRLKPDFTSTEKFCSALAILILVSYLLFPFILLYIYTVRLRSSQPLPDLDDRMTVEEKKYIYGTISIEKIKSTIYFQRNHALFMKKFGILIQGIQISRLGKAWSIIIGFLSIVRQIILSIGVLYFREQPVLLIFLFNTTSLQVALLKINLKPYEDRQKNQIQVFQEMAILLISYSLICFTGCIEPEAVDFVGNWMSVIIIAQIFVFFGLGVQHVLYHLRLLYGRHRYKEQQKLKKKTTQSKVLKRFAAIHTPNYGLKAKQDKQVKVFQLQKVSEEFSSLEESKQINLLKSSQSEVRYEQSKSELNNATSNFKLKKNSQKLLVLEDYSLINEIQSIEKIAEQKQGIQDEQFCSELDYTTKKIPLRVHRGHNLSILSSVVVSDVPSIKSVHVSMSSININERGQDRNNNSGQSVKQTQRLYRKINLSSAVGDEQNFQMKAEKMGRRSNPSSIVSNNQIIYSEKLSSVNLNQSL